MEGRARIGDAGKANIRNGRVGMEVDERVLDRPGEGPVQFGSAQKSKPIPEYIYSDNTVRHLGF